MPQPSFRAFILKEPQTLIRVFYLKEHFSAHRAEFTTRRSPSKNYAEWAPQVGRVLLYELLSTFLVNPKNMDLIQGLQEGPQYGFPTQPCVHDVGSYRLSAEHRAHKVHTRPLCGKGPTGRLTIWRGPL